MHSPFGRRSLFVAALLLLAVTALLAAPAFAASPPHLPDIQLGVEWVTGWTAHADGVAVASVGLAAPFSVFGRRMEPALAPDGGDGDGGDAGKPQGHTREEIEAIAKATLERHGGDTSSATLRLFADHAEKLAETRRQLTQAQADLNKAKTPEGAVVLTGAATETYNRLKGREGYGDDPLGRALADLDTFGTKLTEADQRDHKAKQDEAFRAAGLDPEKVRRYLPDLDARIEGDGDKAKPVAVVKTDGGAETVKPLDEVLAADHAEILPVLQSDASQPARKGGEMLRQRQASGAGNTGKPSDDDVRKGQRKAGLRFKI